MEGQRKPEQEKQTDATSPPETTTERTPEQQASQKTETNNHLDPQTTEGKKEPPQKKEAGTPNHKAKLIAGWTLLLVSVACIATGSVLISIVEKLGRAGKHYQHALVLREKNGSHGGARRELLEVIRLNPEHFGAYNLYFVQ